MPRPGRGGRAREGAGSLDRDGEHVVGGTGPGLLPKPEPGHLGSPGPKGQKFDFCWRCSSGGLRRRPAGRSDPSLPCLERGFQGAAAPCVALCPPDAAQAIVFGTEFAQGEGKGQRELGSESGDAGPRDSIAQRPQGGPEPTQTMRPGTDASDGANLLGRPYSARGSRRARFPPDGRPDATAARASGLRLLLPLVGGLQARQMGLQLFHAGPALQVQLDHLPGPLVRLAARPQQGSLTRHGDIFFTIRGIVVALPRLGATIMRSGGD